MGNTFFIPRYQLLLFDITITCVFKTLIRIWDCFLFEGDEVLFRYSCAIFKLHKNTLLKQNDTISFFKHLKYLVNSTYDVEKLNKVAFHDLNPFPSKEDIRSKQKQFGKLFRKKMENRRQNDLNLTDDMIVDQETILDSSIFIDNGNFH